MKKVTFQIFLIILLNAKLLIAQDITSSADHNAISFLFGPNFNKVDKTLSLEAAYHSNQLKLINKFPFTYAIGLITWGKSVDNIDFRDYAIYFVPQYTVFNENKIQLNIGGGPIVHLLNTKLRTSTENSSKNNDLKLGFTFSGYARYNLHKYFDLAFKTRFQIVAKLNTFELLLGVTGKLPKNLF